jgi:hypothetical protein
MGNCDFVDTEYKRQGGAHMEKDHGGREIGTGKHGRYANTAWTLEAAADGEQY